MTLEKIIVLDNNSAIEINLQSIEKVILFKQNLNVMAISAVDTPDVLLESPQRSEMLVNLFSAFETKQYPRFTMHVSNSISIKSSYQDKEVKDVKVIEAEKVQEIQELESRIKEEVKIEIEAELEQQRQKEKLSEEQRKQQEEEEAKQKQLQEEEEKKRQEEEEK
jgi:hypothetical protein